MVKLVIGLSILFTYTLMVMGNIVTTTGSGLACPDWPLCYGTVIPPLEMQIWFEWSHRLLGALAGFFIVMSAVLARKKQSSGLVKALTGLAVGLLVFGVTLGGIIVLTEAPLLEGPLHLAIISSHIILATTIFTLLILALRYLPGSNRDSAFGIYPVLFGMIFIQVMIGIFVRYGQASLACPDFPLCQGQLVPDLAGFKVTIHILHRFMALAIFIVSGWYFISAIKERLDVLHATITFLLVITQGTLGAYIVWSGMFLPYIVLHGANGFLLLGWTAFLAAPYFIGDRAYMEGAVA